MRTILVVQFLFGIAHVYCTESNKDCTSYKIESCVTTIRQLYGTQEIVVTQDDIVLTSLCRHTQEAMRCINQYVEKCVDKPHRVIYKDLTSGLVDFVREFCDENSPFSKAYRIHLPCYNNLTEEFRECSDFMSRAKHEVETKNMRSTEAIHVLCCNFDRMTSCFRTAVLLNNCSAEAADFVAIIFEKLFGNFTRKLNCEEYNYQDPNCHDSSSTISISSNLILTVCFIWLLMHNPLSGSISTSSININKGLRRQR